MAETAGKGTLIKPSPMGTAGAGETSLRSRIEEKLFQESRNALKRF